MDIDAQDTPEGAGVSISPAQASPRTLDADSAVTGSGTPVNSLGFPYVPS